MISFFSIEPWMDELWTFDKQNLLREQFHSTTCTKMANIHWSSRRCTETSKTAGKHNLVTHHFLDALTKWQSNWLTVLHFLTCSIVCNSVQYLIHWPFCRVGHCNKTFDFTLPPFIRLILGLNSPKENFGPRNNY